MAQADVITATGATYLGIEDTGIGNGCSSIIRAFPIGGSVMVNGFQTEQFPVKDERSRGFAHIKPISGRKSPNSTLKLDFNAKCDSTQLQSPATAVPVTMPYLFELIRALWGVTKVSAGVGSYYVGQGSLIVSNTTSSVTVTAGQGSRFSKGQWIAVQTAAATLTPVKVTNIATDTLSIWPNIPGGLTAGWAVTNGWTFGPAQNHTASLEVQHAKSLGSSVTSAQWKARGVTGNLGLSWKLGELAVLSAELKSATHSKGALSLATTYAAETMATGQVPVVTVSTLLQTFATTTSVNYPVIEADWKCDGGMKQIFNAGANTPGTDGVETVSGVIRIPKRPFATATLKHRFDPTAETDFTSQTVQTIVQIAQIGTGLTARYFGWEMPSCVNTTEPTTEDDDGRLVMTRTFEALEDQNITSGDSDLCFAPIRIFAI